LSLLPVAGITLLINGFNPTRIDTANRHLLIARVTLLDLIAQLLGIAAMVGLAYALQSVWALVLGAIHRLCRQADIDESFAARPHQPLRLGVCRWA
jgi:hypothetical protein